MLPSSSIPLYNQLTTSGANVAAAALPDRDGQLAVGEDLGEPVDLFVRGPLIRDTWRSVEGNQVHLGFNARQQLYEPVRVLGGSRLLRQAAHIRT